MGKKGKDAAKKQAVKEQKAQKQASKSAKSAKKKAAKDGDDDDVEEDIDKVMAELAVAEARKTAVTVTAVERPPHRANFSLNALPSGELVVFGGEFNDGSVNQCYNELYRFNPSSSEWRLVSSPNTPGHRCSHQAALLNNNAALYVYGGEFATSSQFYHYSDTWRLDLATNQWARLDHLKKAPSPRSGHRMAPWRGSWLVLFGGFYQAAMSDRWFGDTWLFDARAGGGAGAWSEVAFPATAQVPSARSGHGLVVVPGRDVAVMYGGYSEEKAGAGAAGSIVMPSRGKASAAAMAAAARKTQSVVHTDLWLLKLAPVLAGGGGAPAWERVRAAGAVPSPRVGFSVAAYRDRLIVFGGVSDRDAGPRGELLDSTFYGDLHSLDIDKRRWYALDVKPKATSSAAKKSSRAAAKKASAAAAGAGSSAEGGADADDAASLGSADDEGAEEAEVEAALAAASLSKRGTDADAGGLDDTAFYYYHEGKLVKLEDDEEGEEGDGSKPVPEPATNEAEKAMVKADAAPSATASGPVPDQSLLSAAAAPLSVSAPSLPQPSTGPSSAAAASASASTPTAAAPAPAPRMKAALWVSGHWLHVYGGLAEGRSREVTFDDEWRLDLRERRAWQCVRPARPHEWKGEDDSDDEADEEEDGEGDDSASGEDASDEDADGAEGGEDEVADGPSSAAGAGAASPGRAKAAVASDEAGSPSAGASGRHGRGHGSSGVGAGGAEGARLRALRDRLGLEDAGVTPQPGEELRDFFARTGARWVATYVAGGGLAEGERIEGKALRRRAFALARARYDELWPTLEELFELEAEQQRREALAAGSRGGRRPGAGGAGGHR